MPAHYEEDFIAGPEPQLVRRYNDGSSVTLKGDRALANAEDPRAIQWQTQNPDKTLDLLYHNGDVRETLPYKLGTRVREFADNPNPTLLGRITEGGPLPGAMVGAGTGLLGGLLAGWLKSKLTGSGSPGTWGLIGALAGGALGAWSGHTRQSIPKVVKEASVIKRAAMYRDPRNFILEKLQAAGDIGLSEKAKLAAAIQKLDYNTAKRLADAVRAAVGFGVGALIAKFIFGASGKGLMLGGLAGVVGGAVLNRAFSNSSSSYSPFIASMPKRQSYNLYN